MVVPAKRSAALPTAYPNAAYRYISPIQACASASTDLIAGTTARGNVSMGEAGREPTVPAADRELHAPEPRGHDVAGKEEIRDGEAARRQTNAETRLVARALYLIRNMVNAGVRSRTASVALAQQVCANSGSIEGAVEIRRLETGAQDRHADDFLSQWRQRNERPRVSVKDHRSADGR